MSKVIFKLKFQSPSFKKTKMNNMYHLIYIGTRDGVALNDDMKEFENNHNNSTNDEYVKYISDRPRSHGLFSKENVNVDIKEVAETMKNYNGYVYRGIVSLKEKEAIEKGYDEKENWESLVRDKMLFISKQLNIPYNKIDWVGAFHRESGHPHIHLMIWNKEAEVRNIGVIPKKNIEAIRKEFTKEIFSNEFENVLSLKNVYRDFLTDTTKGIDNSDYSRSFLELDEKVDEINTRYDVKKLQEKINLLSKEIEESNTDEDVEGKKLEIEELKIKIDETNRKIDMYDIKDTIKGLENEREVINLERELKVARALGNIDKYEDYIYQIKFELGIFKKQKDRKIFSNKKEIIQIKSDLVNLINKQKLLDIKNDFKEKNIDIDLVDNELLNKEQLALKEEYLKLKNSTEHIEDMEADVLEEKIFNLTNKFEKNKWKLDVENEMLIIDNGNEYIDNEFVSEMNNELDNKINACTEHITELKGKVLSEISWLDEYKIEGSEATTLFELEKELSSIKKEYGVDKIENDLNKLKNANKSNIKNDKILGLENKIKELEEDLKTASYENIEYIKKEIIQLKNEINIEKESEINKEIEKLEIELDLAKNEIGYIDIDFNDFLLEDKVRGKTLEEIGEMIVELEVPKGGRLQYKFMPPEVKAEIDKITDRIIEMPQYKKMFDGYIKSVEDLTKLYTDKTEDIEEAKANAKDDIYKRIGNNILKTKKEIVVNNKKPDFAVQKLLTSIAKLFSTNTNKNDKTRLIASENSKAQRKKQYQESKVKGLYSEQDLE